MVETNSTPDHKIDLPRYSEGVWLSPPFISFDLEVARREFASRAENQGTKNLWAGAWANPVGLGSNTYVFHADGTVTSCIGQKARESSHLDDPGDETLFYRLLVGNATKIESWSVSEDGRRLTPD